MWYIATLLVSLILLFWSTRRRCDVARHAAATAAHAETESEAGGKGSGTVPHQNGGLNMVKPTEHVALITINAGFIVINPGFTTINACGTIINGGVHQYLYL